MTKDPAGSERIHREGVLSPDEVARLVGACSRRASSGLRNQALIATLYRAGLRVGEALQIEPGDVDQRERMIVSSRGDRTRRVGLDAGSFRIIECWIERRGELGICTPAPLFCTLAGGPLASSYLRGMLHRLARKAGIEKPVSAEVLRRSLALELVEEGFSIAAIQAHLGHSTAAVTSRYLARMGPASALGDLRGRPDWRL